MADKGDLTERTRGQWWQSNEEMVQVSYPRVEGMGLSALKMAGAGEEDSAFLLSVSLGKAVQGDHARGIEGLAHSVRAAMAGMTDLAPEIQVLRETASTALVDADPRANSTLVCARAMDIAIDKAKSTGIGWVSVRYPAGILTQHLEQAVAAGMVGMVMTQSYPMVAPHGGFLPMLGNAPIGFGIPAGKHDPIIFDASLTQSSASGVKMAAAQGERVPEGFILDRDGNPSTDAADFPASGHQTHDSQLSSGTLLPLGGSHKAYGLVFIVSLLTAVLADGIAPWEAGDVLWGRPADPEERYGSTYMAIDPAAFLDAAEFRRRVDAFIDGIKASPPKQGMDEILYPGERSQTLKRQRREAGSFLIPASHHDTLVALAEELGLGQFLPLKV